MNKNEVLSVCRTFGDAKHCRRILQRALNSVTDWLECVTQAYLDFEREEGESTRCLACVSVCVSVCMCAHACVCESGAACRKVWINVLASREKVGNEKNALTFNRHV